MANDRKTKDSNAIVFPWMYSHKLMKKLKDEFFEICEVKKHYMQFSFPIFILNLVQTHSAMGSYLLAIVLTQETDYNFPSISNSAQWVCVNTERNISIGVSLSWHH